MKMTKALKSSAANPPSPAKRQPPGRPVVLLIEDEQVVREFLKPILEQRAHCRTVEAATRKLALALAEQRKVDVVIYNPARRGMNGYEFLQAFKLAHPNIPVIVHSGMMAGAHEARAYRSGAFRCLSKPAEVELILKVVREAVEHRMAQKGRARLTS